jgi:hypothetical protein
MTSIHTSTTATIGRASLAPLGALCAVVTSTLTAYGAHDWPEVAVTVPVIVAVTALVFGLVLPKALRKESAGGTALALAIPAALLLLPAFWAGIPFVLAVGAMVVGNVGRSAPHGAGKAIAGLAIGALVAAGYVATYVSEIVAGTGGFEYL